MFGIGLVIPLLGILVNGSQVNHELTDFLFSKLSNPNILEMSIYFLLFMVSVYVLKALYLIAISFYQSKFVYDVQKSLSNKLFIKYINAPYLFHIKKNPSLLINNTINETNLFSINVTVPLTIIFSEALVVLFLIILLFVYQPVGASIISIFIIGSSFIFYKYTRNQIKKWGKLRQNFDENKFKTLQSTFSGIREIKVLNKENWFTDIFLKNNDGTAKVMTFQRFLLLLPRLIIEVLGVLSLFLLVFILAKQGIQESEIIVTLGLFSAIAFRVAPSVNKVLISFQEMRYASSIIQRIYQELNSETLNNFKNLENIDYSFNFNEIFIENLFFKYPGQKDYIFENLNFHFNRGAYIGIVGKSGSGKTTFLNLILGLLNPDSGNIFLNKKSIDDSMRTWQNIIGYVPQSVYITEDTIMNNIALGERYDAINIEKVNQVIQQSELSEFISSQSNGLDTLIGEKGGNLSGGQIQRIGLARALYKNPQVLILDESTNSLDSQTESNLLKTFENLSKYLSIIFVTHKMNNLDKCSKIYSLKNKELK